MMALFSRRSKQSSEPAESSEPLEAAPAEGTGAEPATTDTPEAPIDEAPDAAAAASVGISVSSYRGMGSAPVQAPAPAPAPAPVRRAAPPETAPPATETLPGLRDNVLLGAALADLGPTPTPAQILEVSRQLLQGQLLLRVKGDARSLLAQGTQPPLAVVKHGDETFVVVYSSGAAMAASVRNDGDTDTSAMGQAAVQIIRYVLASPHAGIVVDPASAPASAVLRREMLEKLFEGADPAATIKTLLVSERTPATALAVSDALSRVPFWVAVSKVGDTDRLGVAEARTAEGERFLEIFSHPLEAVVLGRGDRPAPMTAEQLGKALRSDPELTGVLVNPAGPWIRLTRADLAGLIAA